VVLADDDDGVDDDESCRKDRSFAWRRVELGVVR
jgi:hypothetical protein